jgi:hypothetical protein
MKVRGGQKQFGIAGKFARDARYGGSVARPKAGIDDQRGAVSDDDRNIGETHDGPNVVRDLCGIFPEYRVPGLGGRGETHGGQKQRSCNAEDGGSEHRVSFVLRNVAFRRWLDVKMLLSLEHT